MSDAENMPAFPSGVYGGMSKLEFVSAIIWAKSDSESTAEDAIEDAKTLLKKLRETRTS